MLRGSVATSPHDYFVARREDLTLERFFDDAVLLRWADMWAEPGRALARRGSSDLRVRYESMLDDPRVALRQLFERLQLPARAGILDDCVEGARFEVMSGGRRPGDMVATAKARRGVAGDWRNYFTRRDGELFEGRVGADLRRLGYADDAHWVDALPERLAWKPGQWRDAP